MHSQPPQVWPPPFLQALRSTFFAPSPSYFAADLFLAATSTTSLIGLLLIGLVLVPSSTCAQESYQVPNPQAELMGHAEQIEGSQPQDISQAAQSGVRGLLSFLQVDPKTSLYRDAVQGKQSEFAPGNGTVILHLRGKEGQPFGPGPDASRYVSQIDEERLKDFAQAVVQSDIAQVKEQLKVPKLPRCSSSRTERIERTVIDKKHASQVFLDVLFVESVPKYLDPHELYGANTTIVRYSNEDPDLYAFTARRLNVECLPSRVRLTGRYRFFHQGDNALLNFDEDSNGDGTDMTHAFEEEK